MHQGHGSIRLEQLEQRLAALEPARRAAARGRLTQLARYAILFVAYLAALATGVVGAIRFTGMHVSQAPIVFGGAGLLTAVVITYLAVRAVQRMAQVGYDPGAAYDAAHFETVVLPALREVLPGCTVSAASSIDGEAFDASALFAQRHDVYEGRCGVEGRSGDATWRASALRVRRWARDQHGNRASVAAFTGTYLHVAHHIDLPHHVRLVTEDIGSGEGRFGLIGGAMLRHAETGDHAFDSQFRVLMTSRDETLPALPPHMREACLEVRRQLERPFFLAFNATGSYVAIPGPAYQLPPFEPGGITAPDAQRLADDVELMGRLPGVVAALQQSRLS